MKTLLLSLTALFISVAINAQVVEPTTYTLTVKISNATTDDGMMLFGLNTKDNFMKSAPYKGAEVTIKDGIAIATFKNIPAGEYAVMVHHDLNGDKQMNFKNGMPTEAYGMSNNPMSYGPPQWGDAKFTLDNDKKITVRL